MSILKVIQFGGVVVSRLFYAGEGDTNNHLFRGRGGDKGKGRG